MEVATAVQLELDIESGRRSEPTEEAPGQCVECGLPYERIGSPDGHWILLCACGPAGFDP